MMTRVAAYITDGAIPLPGSLYFDFIIEAIQKANQRVWVTMFMIRPLVEDDSQLVIRGLLKALQSASIRNIEVRLLIGSSGVQTIEIGNYTTIKYLDLLGVPVRIYHGDRRRSLHSKYVILDQRDVVVGSHNWTPSASVRENEDSVFVRSASLNNCLATEFLQLWSHATTRTMEATP